MADISKITLPSGSTYDIKDAVAREAISAGFSCIISTDASNTPNGITWKSGETTITGTLAASASTKGVFYLVPSTTSASGDSDIYDEYITVGTSTYSWEKLGNTQLDIGSLGSLAYKSSASGSYTPAGTVSAPDITVTPSTATKYVAESASAGGSYTAGSVTEGSVTAGSFTANTPTAVTLPTLNMTVSDEKLTMSWTAGSVTAGKAASCTPTQVTLPTIKMPSVTMPSFKSQTIATGISSATSSQPTFTGTAKNVSVS